MIDQLCGERKLFNSNNDIGEKNLENIVVMTLDKGKQGPQYMSTDLTVNEEKSKVRTKEMIKDIEKFKKIRTCSRIVGIGLKTLHGDKRYYQSGIVKKGNSWYVTEFNTGYTVFEIEHHKGIVDFNNPKEIYTLSTPFIGNNHAISPTTDDFFYITDDGTYLTKFNLKSLTSGSIKKFPIIKDNINIYSQVNGTSAIHVDSGYAWLVYNKDQNNHLTISRIDKNNLEEIRRIKLNKFDRKISSSFISCGIFYGIECAGIQCRILPIYDLIHGKYVLRKDKFNVVGHWNSYGNIKSVSYDSVTHMLAILDDDKIYSIQLKVL
uniref:Olfactomedin-like domain-containing protein n=1 Tax=Parastrongyloides trichosuri TaxID=131310 RepID=A0A0N4ZWR8_PARTI